MSTPIQPVPPAPEPPAFPTLADRPAGVYNQKAYAWAVYWGGEMMTRLMALVANVWNNATSAAESASVAQAGAESASNAAAVAMAGNHFKGAWSSLAGALNRPASVIHNGQYWMLLNDLLDVAASEPGVDTANWAPMIDLKDAAVPATGGVMDCSKGDTFTLTVNGNVALSFVNVPTRAYDPVLEILHISGTITIPAGAVWANGKVPEFLTGRRHLLFFHRAHTGSGGWIMSALEGSAS